MKTTIKQDDCRRINRATGGLWQRMFNHIAGHLDTHIANCPRCQKRLGMINRVELALLMMRSQPHKLSLFSQANEKALKMLAHPARFSPEADQLRQSVPAATWFERNRVLVERIAALAACLIVLVMIKAGVYSSFEKVQSDGQAALHNYYAKNLDTQTADELFGPNKTTV